jgi:hypothetical protein
MMRFVNIKLFFSLVVFSFLALVSTAQFDDLYYDPNDNSGSILDSDYSDSDDSYVYNDSDEYYSDYDSDYYDDYYDDYTYTRRINRFRRNSCSLNNYYSSVFYNDPFYNDPFFSPFYPGANSLIHISFGNGFGRWNRWNNWGYNSWNNWRFNSWNNWGFNSWNNPYCGPGFGFANAGFYNGFNNFNYGNIYINNGNNTNNPNGSHFGSRRNGSVSSSTNGRTKAPRLTAPTRDTESGLVSSSSPSNRTDGVRKTIGDGKTSSETQNINSTKRNDNVTTPTRRRSNGDTIYSGRKRSSRSSDGIIPSSRRPSQGVNRGNSSNRSNSPMSTRSNTQRNSSGSFNRSNRTSNRSSSTRSSSIPSSSRSGTSRTKKRGGE